MAIEGSQSSLARVMHYSCKVVFEGGCFAAVQVAIWADVLVTGWLGPSHSDVAALIQVLAIALPGYLVYCVLRSVIDAIEVKPMNLFNLCASLILATGTSLALGHTRLGIYGLAAGTVVGTSVLGVLSAVFLARRGFHFFAARQSIQSVSIVVIFGVLALVLRRMLTIDPMVTAGIILFLYAAHSLLKDWGLSGLLSIRQALSE